jgi:hypothetical protein
MIIQKRFIPLSSECDPPLKIGISPYKNRPPTTYWFTNSVKLIEIESMLQMDKSPDIPESGKREMF